MKTLLTFLIFICALFAYSSPFDSAFGRVPTMSPKEASAIKEASEANDVSKALEILKEASSKKWAGSAIWFNLANVQMSCDDTASAIESYRQSIKLMPSFFMAQKNLAFALEKVGREDEAFVEMKKALALSGGSDCSILSRLALRSARKGDFSSALNFCNQALMYDSSNKEMYFAKAIFLFELGMFAECEKICTSILSQDENHVEALRLIGKSRATRGDYKSAISAFEILKKSGKAKVPDIVFLGDLLAREKLYQRSAENYLKADKQESLEKVAFAMLYSDDALGALKLSDKLAKPAKLKLVGLANANLSKNIEAKKNLEEYLTIRADDLYVALRLADIYFAEGQYSKSQALYVQCQSDSKMMLSALYGEMKVEIAKLNYRQALRLAKRIEKINPTSEISNYAKLLEKHCSEME